VFYKDSTLYIYDLFSSKTILLNKDIVGGLSSYLPLSVFIYKIVYYDANNNAKYIYFIKNFLCSDFDAIIDEFN
jgi:F0F1-type ATP synthase assembly protein I